MKHPSWANYIVTSGKGIGKVYLDKLSPGYLYLEVGLFEHCGDDRYKRRSISRDGGAVLKRMISYEFIGEEEN